MLTNKLMGASGEAQDPNFENVTLLLHGDGTNGAQNNTFIAGNGAAQGPFAKEAGMWGVQFDGSGDWLVPNGLSNLDSGDFTVEFWLYSLSSYSGSYAGILDSRVAGNAIGQVFLGYNATANRIEWNENSVTLVYGTVAANTWMHVAVSRASGTLRFFVDGVISTSATNTSNYNTPFRTIGKSINDLYFNGYISNLRIVKGTALYTSNFTVPTSPLTAISGTSLLTCQSNVICDNSANTFAITAYGDAKVTTQAPFSNSSSYSPYSYSGYFDGSGDSLSAASNAVFAVGTGDFTVEAWIYPQAWSTYAYVLGVATSGGLVLSKEGSNFVVRAFGVGDQLQYATLPTLNTWTHVAATRNGTTLRLFYNGVQVASTTNSYNFTQGVAYVGNENTNAAPWNGYISNLRLVKGTAVYTSNFVPSNAPLTAITNTSLLTCQSATFVDNSPNNFTITVNGNTTVATAENSGLPITRNGNTTQGSFSPYGNLWSNYFDGSGDYLSVPDNAALDLGTGDFCIESFINLSVLPNSSGVYQSIIGKWETPGTQYSYLFNVGTPSGGTLSLILGTVGSGTYQEASRPISIQANVWYHVAVTRSSGIVRFFLDGIQQGTGISFTWNFVDYSNNVNIGRHGDGINYFNGYMSSLRLVKGTAVYTSNFTPPTAPLTAISGTSLLTCQSNRFIDNSSNNFTITVAGDTKVTNFSPFSPSSAYSPAVNGGSGYFDGSGDYLTLASNTAFDFGTGDFTVDFWVYPTTFAAYQTVVGTRPDSSNYATAYSIGYSNAGTLYMYTNGFVATSAVGVLRVSEWNYVAVTRSGTTVQFYVNGVSSGTAGTNNQSFSGYPVRINGNGNGTEQFTGYVSSVRVIKGTAITTTLPTSPLTAISGTSLLCNFTNAGIYDNSMKNDLETVGNAQISTSVKKYGTGSMYFDGSGDYLIAPSNTAFAFGTGDFTIEFWAYWNGGSFTTYATAVDTRSSSGGGGLGIAANITTGYWYVTISTQEIISSTAATAGWQHIAVTRSGTSLKLFVNGVQGGSTYTTSTNFSNTTLRVGSQYGSAYYWNGYIDDLRITKGVARYTADFTPPTQAFPNQ